MFLNRYALPQAAKIVMCLLLLTALYFIYKAALVPLSFDDAYMFTRYAKNILLHHGFGWNAGERTYGCTSIAYVFFITLAEYIAPKIFAGDAFILKFSSLFWGITALLLIYKSLKIVTANALLKKVYFPNLVMLIILFMPVVTYNLFNGMDATMSLFGNALMIFLFLQYQQRQSLLLLLAAALSAYLTFFIRPDNGICMMLFPGLFLWIIIKKIKPLIITYAVIFTCLAIDMWVKYLYFGYVLPLPFYVKSFGLFDGYLGIAKWNATENLANLFLPFSPLIIMFILFIKKPSLKRISVYWLPLVFTCIYFYSVVEVMGMASRYYLPFIPFFTIGLAAGLSESVSPDTNFYNLQLTGFTKRILILLLLFPVLEVFNYFSGAYYTRLYAKAENEAKKYALNKNFFTVNPLPEIDWWQAILIFDSLVKQLPANTTVAASEDGFVGSENINTYVTDLSELHNNEILKKHSSAYFIEKYQPDVIWLPHNDYTKIRYEILMSPGLLKEYDFYPQLLNYGIAIKKKYAYYNSILFYFESLYKTNHFNKY